MDNTSRNRPSRVQKRPTLKTISELSGLAVPTVSRALNDAPDIGESTKRRVRDIAREIGYRRNRAGLRLRTGKTNVLALVLSTDHHDTMNHTARLITAIAAATRHTPYHLIVTPYFPDEDPMKPVKYIVESESADGVILNQILPEDPRVAYLMANRMPFVTHGRTVWCDEHAYVDFDTMTFGRVCVRRLAARGRKNVLVIAPPMEQNYAQDLMQGVEAEAAEIGIKATRLPWASSDSTPTEIEDGISRYIQAYPETDSIVCASATSAMSATVAIERAGRTIGQDVDIIAKEAIPILENFRSGILTVFEDVSAAGTRIGEALIQAIDHPELPPIQTLDVPQCDEG